LTHITRLGTIILDFTAVIKVQFTQTMCTVCNPITVFLEPPAAPALAAALVTPTALANPDAAVPVTSAPAAAAAAVPVTSAPAAAAAAADPSDPAGPSRVLELGFAAAHAAAHAAPAATTLALAAPAALPALPPPPTIVDYFEFESRIIFTSHIPNE